MKERSMLLLEELAHCDRGAGLALVGKHRKDAAVLMRRGLAEWFEAAGIRVYTITPEGRAYLQRLAR